LSLKPLSEQHTATDGAVDVLQLLLRHFRVLGVDVDYHIADFLVGLQNPPKNFCRKSDFLM
jgi:hypothetical protein